MFGTAISARRSMAVMGAGVLAFAVTAFTAIPVSADSEDVQVSKTADRASATPGQTVNYEVEVRGTQLIDFNEPFQNKDSNVYIFDDVPEHMTVTSASVTHNQVGRSLAYHLLLAGATGWYGGGDGWSGDWVEEFDDGNAQTGQAKSTAGLFSLKSNDENLPQISRSINPTGPVRSVLLAFESTRLGLTDANDQIIAELSFDGGATWPVSEVIDGTPGSVGTHRIGSENLSADTVTVRFRVLTAGTFGGIQALNVSGVRLWYVSDESTTTTPLDLATVVDSNGDLTVGTWDIWYGDTVYLNYSAVVDSVIADETPGSDVQPTVTTELINTLTVASDDDPAGEVTDYTLYLDRNPAFDIDLDDNGPVHVGQPLVITATVTHSSDSDGFPLCNAYMQANLPPYDYFTLISGDDGDGCLEYSETWTFTHAFAGVTDTSGLVGLEIGLFGDGPGGAPFMATEDLAITVVLGDSGPEDVSGLLVTVAGLIASGVALMFVRTRREN